MEEEKEETQPTAGNVRKQMWGEGGGERAWLLLSSHPPVLHLPVFLPYPAARGKRSLGNVVPSSDTAQNREQICKETSH